MLSTRPKKKKKTESSAHECVRIRINGILNSLFFFLFVFLVASTLVVNDCKTNELIIVIAVGRPLGHPWGIQFGEPQGEWNRFDISFSSWGMSVV